MSSSSLVPLRGKKVPKMAAQTGAVKTTKKAKSERGKAAHGRQQLIAISAA